MRHWPCGLTAQAARSAEFGGISAGLVDFLPHRRCGVRQPDAKLSIAGQAALLALGEPSQIASSVQFTSSAEVLFCFVRSQKKVFDGSTDLCREPSLVNQFG